MYNLFKSWNLFTISALITVTCLISYSEGHKATLINKIPSQSIYMQILIKINVKVIVLNFTIVSQNIRHKLSLTYCSNNCLSKVIIKFLPQPGKAVHTNIITYVTPYKLWERNDIFIKISIVPDIQQTDQNDVHDNQ